MPVRLAPRVWWRGAASRYSKWLKPNNYADDIQIQKAAAWHSTLWYGMIVVGSDLVIEFFPLQEQLWSDHPGWQWTGDGAVSHSASPALYPLPKRHLELKKRLLTFTLDFLQRETFWKVNAIKKKIEKRTEKEKPLGNMMKSEYLKENVREESGSQWIDWM